MMLSWSAELSCSSCLLSSLLLEDIPFIAVRQCQSKMQCAQCLVCWSYSRVSSSQAAQLLFFFLETVVGHSLFRELGF